MTAKRSRRDFIKAGAAALGAAPLAALAAEPADAALAALDPASIVARFAALPGDVGFEIRVPAVAGGDDFVAQLQADRRLFCASSLKTFALCEALRQHDAPDVVAQLEQRALILDSSIWSFGSPIYNPPDLYGMVSLRSALEAMILRSDNTATDMVFKAAGVANIRHFIAAAGLARTSVPDSTRALTGYLCGAPNYASLDWEQLLAVAQQPMIHPFLNDVQSLASSAGDFVSYYARALQGEFFAHAQTLQEFRRILTLCDYIYLIPLPLGASAWGKSGNADIEGFHARCFAGGMYSYGRWMYFAFVINWYAQAASDPATVDAWRAAIEQSLAQLQGALGGQRPQLAPPLRTPPTTGSAHRPT